MITNRQTAINNASDDGHLIVDEAKSKSAGQVIFDLALGKIVDICLDDNGKLLGNVFDPDTQALIIKVA